MNLKTGTRWAAKRRKKASGGSTLLLALWALLLLSAILFAWIERVNLEIDGVQAANRGLEARAMAHSGLAVGMHPNVSRNSPNLENHFDHDRSYRVTIESEGGRLNLNYFLAGADPTRLKFLRDFLTQRGFSFAQRDQFIDCLLDWTNPGGGRRRANAVPESPDYHPPHRPLQSLDEIARVAGSGPLVARAHWQDELTIYSSGPLDLESVSAELLSLVPGVSAQRAQQFVAAREKCIASGLYSDGRPFRDIPDALKYLGLTQEQFSQLSPFLSFRDPVLRIHSEGHAGESVHTVEVVTQKDGGGAQILLWNEK